MTPAEEANDLIREVITLAKQERDYKPALTKLRALAKEDKEVDQIYRYLLKSVKNRLNE